MPTGAQLKVLRIAYEQIATAIFQVLLDHGSSVQVLRFQQFFVYTTDHTIYIDENRQRRPAQCYQQGMIIVPGVQPKGKGRAIAIPISPAEQDDLDPRHKWKAAGLSYVDEF